MLGHLAGGLFIPKLLTRDWRTLSGVDTHTLQKMSRMSETRTPVILVYKINWWWWIIDKSYWAILYTIKQNVEMCVLTPVLCSYAAMYYLQTPSVTQELKHESDHASWRHLYYIIRIWGADLLDSWTIKVHITYIYVLWYKNFANTRFKLMDFSRIEISQGPDYLSLSRKWYMKIALITLQHVYSAAFVVCSQKIYLIIL